MIEEKINKIVNGKPNSLSIQYNEGWSFYEPLDTEYIDRQDLGLDEKTKQEILTKQQIWSLVYYPNTPVGSLYVAHWDLEKALDLMVEAIEADKKRFVI